MSCEARGVVPERSSIKEECVRQLNISATDWFREKNNQAVVVIAVQNYLPYPT